MIDVDTRLYDETVSRVILLICHFFSGSDINLISMLTSMLHHLRMIEWLNKPTNQLTNKTDFFSAQLYC